MLETHLLTNAILESIKNHISKLTRNDENVLCLSSLSFSLVGSSPESRRLQ